MIALSPRDLARALGGDVAGRGCVCPGPGHSRQDRSLSVVLSASAPDGLLVHSHAGDDWRECRDHVRAALGLAADSRGEGALTHNVRSEPRPVTGDFPSDPADDAERTRRALAIWDEARDPRGTAVEMYLGGRALALTDEIAGEVIRFHPACPFTKGHRTPAMVALVRDAVTNVPKAIHRTALSLDGRKAEVNGQERLTYGPLSGGAVKLTPDEEVITCLGIGEGVETALSMRLLPEFGASPVWSLLTAGGVASFPVLVGVECLWIAVDHDPNGAGDRAADACATRWQAAGREVFLIRPKAAGSDINDIITNRRAAK